MFQINDDNSIYVTRGDIAVIAVSAVDKENEPYLFLPGDLLRIKVYGKKDVENVVLQKDFPVLAESYTVDLYLDENDTKIGEVISKPVDYWYEIELDPLSNPQTIVGYDDDGAKVFKLFPEGRDLGESDPITPEDIPIVDEELDLASTRPVENRAVARAVERLKSNVEGNAEKVEKLRESTTADTVGLKQEIATERARVTNLLDQYTGKVISEDAKDKEVIDGRVDGLTVHKSLGDAIRAKTKADFELLEATKYAQPIIPFMDRLEIGFVEIKEDGLTYKNYTNYVRTKEGVTIHLDKGDKITCSNETRVYTGYWADGKYNPHAWTSNFTAEVSADYVLLFSDYDIADIADLDTFLKNITITKANNYSAQIEELNKTASHLLKVENTYLSNSALAIGDATSTNPKRYCAKLDHPVYAMKITKPDTVKYGIQGYSNKNYTSRVYDSGWLTSDDFISFENPDLYYVIVFIRIDETNPTVEDRANTTVLQSLSLTSILDNFKGYMGESVPVSYDSTNDLIRSVAHRGLSDSAPENTIPAFVLAKKAGFTYVETDIQVTKDGKYVCIHDDTISKYTGKTGTVADYTLAELKAMDFGAWKDAKWAGTKVLTFEEFVLLCKKLGLKMYIELKYTHSESDIAYYLNYVKKMGMSENCVWRGAADNSVIRALSDTAILAYDASSIMTEERVKTIVERYSPLFFHNDYSKVTKEIVELCHNYGVRIEVYTVNDEDTLENLAEMGVDGITTDKLVAGKIFYENLV